MLVIVFVYDLFIYDYAYLDYSISCIIVCCEYYEYTI